MSTGGAVQESVQDYYGKVLSTSKDLKTSACTASAAPSQTVKDIIRKIPSEINSKFYGCGTPIPMGIDGLNVLDLGSGSGRDCYIASALVGENGKVTGIDMTDEQLDVAKKYVDEFTTGTMGFPKPNLEFKKGYIENIAHAGVENESQDIVMSNCVINLSPDKPSVLKGCYDSLKFGGELYFSDVYVSRRLPQHVMDHEVLWGECLSGGLYIEDFKRICHDIGFTDPRVLEAAPIVVTDPELADICGEAKFYSITYRCFKLPGRLETLCEDYGQYAVYKGTIPTHPNSYVLDDHHKFETGKPMLVCGNTGSMVGESWLAPHFEVVGDRSTHFGLFDCGDGSVAPAVAAANTPDAGASCC